MNHETVIDDAGPFEKMVSFEISSSELQQAMNRAARRISREVNIPGFRPGRAPRRLVERRVGTDQLRSDALDELVPPRVQKILSETEIVPVVAPLLESTTDTAAGAVRLKVRVTTWPRLESVPDYRGRRVQVSTLTPISEEVQDHLDRLAYLYAPLQTRDRAARKADFAVIDMTVTDGEKSLASLALDGFSYEVGSARLTPEIDEDLEGRRAGDEFEVQAPLPDWLPAEALTHYDFEDEDGQASGLYRIRVVEVQTRSVPDLDDEWASEYTGHDSLDDLREEIRGELEEDRNTRQWDELVSKTVEEAVADLELQLPERLEGAQTEGLFHNYLHSLERAKLDYSTFLERAGLEHEQFIEQLRQRAAIGLKTRILTQSVIEEQSLVVDDAEVMEFLDDMARDASDPEGARQQIEQDVDLDQIRGEMLAARAHAFLAMQVEPVDDQGRPAPIRPPARVKVWFEPRNDAEQISNPEPDATGPLYEAEVIG